MPAILFIAPADLGEAALATGALEALTGADPEAEIIVVCAKPAAALYRAAPGVVSLRPWTEGEGPGPWVALAWEYAGRPFDLAVDLDGTPAAFALRAKRRVARRASRVLRHRLEDFAAIIGSDVPLRPRLYLDDEARAAAAAAAPEAAPLIVLAPGGAAAQRWAPERFAAVARRLVSGPLSGAGIVLLGDITDADVARAVATSLLSDGLASRNVAGELDALAGAALMERATLFIGNDGWLMHIAAIMGAPTLGLFGPSDERVRGPIGPRVRTLRARAYEDIMAARDGAGERGLLDDISIDAAEEMALDLLRAGGLK